MHRVTHVVLVFVMLSLAWKFLDEKPSFVEPTYSFFITSGISEHEWGFFCLMFGLFGMVTIFVRSWSWRIVSSGALAVAHGVIAMMFWLGHGNGPAPEVYGGYAAIATALGYSYAHLGQRYKDGMAPTDLP